MTHFQKVICLFVLLLICLFTAIIMPSPKIIAWLGWTGDGMQALCILMGFFGSVITFFVLLMAICEGNKKANKEEKEETGD